MIDIKKAISYVQNMDLSKFTDKKEAEKAVDLITSILHQQQYNGWISVSEQLPEDRHYPPVICCNIIDGWTDAAVVSGNGYFINCEGTIIYPTHWKPLPEPWKGSD